MNSIGVATRRLTRAAFALLVCSLTTSLAQAQSPAGDNTLGQLAGKSATPSPILDFKLYRGHLIVVPGSAGELKHLRFLVDTSAEGSIADRRLVEKLQAKQRSGTLDALGETLNAGRAVLPDVQVGPLSAKSLSVFAVDLSYLEQELGTHIDMLIGLDVLGQSSFTIDYAAKRIVFGRPPALPITVPMESGPSLVSVTVSLDGQPLRMLVNSGFPALMLEGANGKAAIHNVKMDRAKLTINAAGGQMALRQVLVRSVRLGEIELGQQPAFVLNAQKNVFDGSLPIPGGFREVAFDFERQVLAIRK